MGVKLLAVGVLLLWTVANAQVHSPQSRTSCTSNFFPGQPTVEIYGRRASDNGLDITSIDDCKRKCLEDNDCRSFTMVQWARRRWCFNQDGTDTGSKIQVTSFERNCMEPSCGKQSPLHPPVFYRVVGGEEANPHSWPWTVALQYSNGIRCGGSIIGKRWILTAKHCLDPPPIAVVVGAHNITRQEASKRVYHPSSVYKYSGDKYHYDIGLVELPEDIEYTDEVRPICLPSISASGGPNYIAAGWGLNRTSRVDVLNQVDLKLIPHHLCSSPAYYGRLINPTTMICAGYEHGGKDTCKGDSGGPLMSRDSRGRYILYGVTSAGAFPCGQARKPGVYMKVQHFVDWIQRITNNAVETA